MLILGRDLPDHRALKIALTTFYGIGRLTAQRVMARYSIHDSAKVGELTAAQLTSLSAFLSSPATSPKPPRTPLASPFYNPAAARIPRLSDGKSSGSNAISTEGQKRPDAMAELKIETELRRLVRENIAHHRNVGTYIGRRHAMHLPVRGQNTRNNAMTARKFNRIERRG